MRGVTYAKGVAAASAAAGPLFLLPPVLASLLWDRGDVGTKLMLVPVALIVALPVGFALALLPNLAGTALLAAGGRGNVGLRLWPMWALAGAGAGWLIDLAIEADGPGAARPMIALVGVPCALLCRWGTRWSE